MADEKKKVVVASGMVQKFPDSETVAEKDVNGQTVREFTIKTTTQKLIRVSVWEDHDDFDLQRGDTVWVEGGYSEFTGNNGTVFRNISAYEIAVTPKVPRKERQVVNKKKATTKKAAEPVDEESF